jgi:hypothetical protein
MYKREWKNKPAVSNMITKVLEENEKDKEIIATSDDNISSLDKKIKTESLNKFTMDELGRVIDSKGNILSMVN